MNFHSWLALAIALRAVAAFNFTASNEATECGEFKVDWEGGTAPYNVIVIPGFGTPRNYTVSPDSADGDKWSYTIDELTVPANDKIVVSVSDSTGILGTTSIMNVASSSGASCNTSDPGIDFEFQLNSALKQCDPYEFTGFTRAELPISIYAIVPNGETVILHPEGNTRKYDWTANVYNGTTLIFVMVDSQGRKGGASDFMTVASSNNNACVNEDSPTTTASPQTTSEPSSSNESSSSDDSVPKAAIFAAVFGSLIFLAVIISLALFYLRKRNQRNNSGPMWINSNGKPTRRPRQELDVPSGYQYPYSPSTADPFHAEANTPVSRSQVGSVYVDDAPPIDPFMNPPPPLTGGRGRQDSMSSSLSPSQRKAAAAGIAGYKPSRYVLHTDIDDMEPKADENGVVELPPQYSERRGPPPPLISPSPIYEEPQPMPGSSRSPPPHDYRGPSAY